MDWYRIIETDNFDGDYPDEKFATPYALRKDQADVLCVHFNNVMNPGGLGPRYWRVVPADYQLQPGFEP